MFRWPTTVWPKLWREAWVIPSASFPWSRFLFLCSLTLIRRKLLVNSYQAVASQPILDTIITPMGYNYVHLVKDMILKIYNDIRRTRYTRMYLATLYIVTLMATWMVRWSVQCVIVRYPAPRLYRLCFSPGRDGIHRRQEGTFWRRVTKYRVGVTQRWKLRCVAAPRCPLSNMMAGLPPSGAAPRQHRRVDAAHQTRPARGRRMVRVSGELWPQDYHARPAHRQGWVCQVCTGRGRCKACICIDRSGVYRCVELPPVIVLQYSVLFTTYISCHQLAKYALFFVLLSFPPSCIHQYSSKPVYQLQPHE